ncbi:hypothetical protein CUJ84_pRLN3000546 (plasmid) [Rhizobium leguminosarum]|uniref:Uncharacterized protein n=1 Tax=Rhizobium leguminosarum TaxID=384 RepID=A0A2K9ZHF1_RHILE|nr:hypothetical protein CUJ84_pRLN3000546 [Rhizobium leguminosarum]
MMQRLVMKVNRVSETSCTPDQIIVPTLKVTAPHLRRTSAKSFDLESASVAAPSQEFIAIPRMRSAVTPLKAYIKLLH